jgi:hypothetical protein
MKLVLGAFVSLAAFLYSHTGHALDLSKQKNEVFYECKTLAGGGLHKSPETGDIIGTMFNIPPGTLELRLLPVQKDDIEKLPDECLKALINDIPAKKTEPIKKAFCLTTAAPDLKGVIHKLTQGCVFTTPSLKSGRYHALACGRDSSIFFDTDRSKGIVAKNNFLNFELSEMTSLTVFYFSCERLDR